MQFYELLGRRRMVRNYLPRPVPDECLERILQAGLRGPSAGFAQGQHLCVVTSAERRRGIAELAGEADYVARGFDPWLSRAPVHLLLCCDPDDYRRRYAQPDKNGLEEWPVPYWLVDAGAAFMLILLAAVEEGLAAGFLGAHRLEGVRALLQIPDSVEVIGLITLGYAAPDRRSSSLAAGRRPPAEVIHREVWGGG